MRTPVVFHDDREERGAEQGGEAGSERPVGRRIESFTAENAEGVKKLDRPLSDSEILSVGDYSPSTSWWELSA